MNLKTAFSPRKARKKQYVVLRSHSSFGWRHTIWYLVEYFRAFRGKNDFSRMNAPPLLFFRSAFLLNQIIHNLNHFFMRSG